MPVTRNRLGANCSKSAPDSAATITTAGDYTSETLEPNRSLSRNSSQNAGTNSPEEHTRQLRDRNTLMRPANAIINSQQQQIDSNNRSMNHSDRASPNAKKPKLQTQPTRVLPRRSSTRPQALLNLSTTTLLAPKIERDGSTINNQSEDEDGDFQVEREINGTTRNLGESQEYQNSSNTQPKDMIDGPTEKKSHHGAIYRGPAPHNLSRQSTSLLSYATKPNQGSWIERHRQQHQRDVVSNTVNKMQQPLALPACSSRSSKDTDWIGGAKRTGPIDQTSVPLNLKKNPSNTTNSECEIITRDHHRHQKLVPPPQPPQSSSDFVSAKKNFNILIAVTGSVATVKLIELIKKLEAKFPKKYNDRTENKTYEATISIKVLMTEHSKHFVSKTDILKACPTIEILDDADEWAQWKTMGDPVLHIELRKWADLLVIAPLDANTMAKMAYGLCDNLLSCVVRAWDTAKKLIYCPAMNVHMYNHPITREQLARLQSFGYTRVDCIEKKLACGDVGLGAMAEVETIADRVVDNLLRPIPRLTSPIKSLLNHQPTYPIMSTASTSTSTTNLMDRFRPSSHVSLHTVSHKPVKDGSQVASRNGYTSLLGKPRISNNLAPSKKLMSEQNNNHLPTGNGLVRACTQSNSRSNLVKSLKNLQAINPGLVGRVSDDILDQIDDDDDDDEEDEEERAFNNEYNGDGEDDEFFADAGMDLSTEITDYSQDPSKLLEHHLVMEGDSSFQKERHPPQRSRTPNLQPNSNRSSTSHNSSWTGGSNHFHRDSFSPIFNTSKFLNSCYVKERDVFNCAICKNDYKNRKSMSRHLREQHVQGNIYECVPCGQGFKRREKLIKHNRDHHGHQ